MISLNEALGLIEHARIEPRTEIRSLDAAMGCCLAEGISADRDYPPFNRSMMDGFALSRQYLLAHPDHVFPVVGRVLAGEPAPEAIPEGTALRIMTGAPVPPSLDLVIPLEKAEYESAQVGPGHPLDSATVCFPGVREKAPRAFDNIAPRGEDCAAGSTLLPAGCRITAPTIGAIAAAGHGQARVFAPPRVGIITTGAELVDITTDPRPHQIRDSNGWVLRAFLREYAIEPEVRLCVKDSREAIENAAGDLIDCDVLILTGAVSTGDTDFVPDVLAGAGVKTAFHGVSIKPGKPVLFGHGPGGLVFGLPGNPFAVQCTFRVFVLPAICRFLGLHLPVLELPLTAERTGGSRSEFFPVAFATGPRGTGLLPLGHRGSGDLLAAARSAGLALHDSNRPVIHPGDPVRFFPWGPSFTAANGGQA